MSSQFLSGPSLSLFTFSLTDKTTGRQFTKSFVADSSQSAERQLAAADPKGQWSTDFTKTSKTAL